jgi:hypothetical protein
VGLNSLVNKIVAAYAEWKAVNEQVDLFDNPRSYKLGSNLVRLINELIVNTT